MFGRRRREREKQQRLLAQKWQLDIWEWSRTHPGMPVMEGEITRIGTRIVWNGPRPPKSSDGGGSYGRNVVA